MAPLEHDPESWNPVVRKAYVPLDRLVGRKSVRPLAIWRRATSAASGARPVRSEELRPLQRSRQGAFGLGGQLRFMPGREDRAGDDDDNRCNTEDDDHRAG